MKKKLLLLGFLISSLSVLSQPFRNFGNTQIHKDAQIGFFNNIINDGVFDNYSGLAGFYGTSTNAFSGLVSPIFNDVELANDEGLQLDIPILVTNNVNFVYGDFITSKTSGLNYLVLDDNAFYVGDSDFSKVNGYIQMTNSGNFLFPVGDEFYLRPMGVTTNVENATLKSVYVFKNPLAIYFKDQNLANPILAISRNEFWKLEGDSQVSITLSWNARSSIHALTRNTQFITIVGYHKIRGEWVNLGAVETTGTLNEGLITSESFIPEDYEALSFGSVYKAAPLNHKGYHYLVTPNNDGINDFLYIPELEDYAYNKLMIFDRNGLKVFEAENYSNEFDGVASANIPVINRSAGLPQEIYYYLVHLNKESLTLQGFLYLQRQ